MEQALAQHRVAEAGYAQNDLPLSSVATAGSGGAWPLSTWMPLFADLAAAPDIPGFWKCLSVLLEMLVPYRTAIAWNDWATVVFGEAPASPVEEATKPIPRGIWFNHALAVVPLHLSGPSPPPGPFSVVLAQLPEVEYRHRIFQSTGWEHALVIPFRRGDRVRAGITLFRSGEEGPFIADAVARVRVVYSLLDALARRMLEQERHQTLQSSVLDVLDDLSVGLLLLDWELQPVLGNTQGYQQTRRWNDLSMSTAQAEAQEDFHLPDELRAVCMDLRQRWAANLPGTSSDDGNPRQEIRHPLHQSFKAVVEVPQQQSNAVGTPSFLIRYNGMASRAGSAVEPTSAQLAVLAQLTPGQRNVALLVMQGKSNREIAAQLHREISTVKDHLGHIYDTLGIRNRTQLAALFAE